MTNKEVIEKYGAEDAAAYFAQMERLLAAPISLAAELLADAVRKEAEDAARERDARIRKAAAELLMQHTNGPEDVPETLVPVLKSLARSRFYSLTVPEADTAAPRSELTPEPGSYQATVGADGVIRWVPASQ